MKRFIVLECVGWGLTIGFWLLFSYVFSAGFWLLWSQDIFVSIILGLCSLFSMSVGGIMTIMFCRRVPRLVYKWRVK